MTETILQSIDVRDAQEYAALTVLRESPDYRILKRFRPRPEYTPQFMPPGALLGAYLDCEATSTDPDTAKLIELGAVFFRFDPATCAIGGITYARSWFRDPGEPIPPAITTITGITDEMVAGQSIDVDLLAATFAEASVFVAHSAGYDRRVIERELPQLLPDRAPWACSYRDVDWAAAGYRCAKLGHLLQDAAGEFYDAHRAELDCRVGLHLLATTQLGGRSAFAELLESTRRPTRRIFAMGFPREKNALLKFRTPKYRWSGGEDGRPKAWWTDVRDDEALRAELAFLRMHMGAGYAPPVQTISARDRYSIREDR